VGEFDPNAYGQEFAALISTDLTMPLDAGRPNLSVRQELSALTVESSFEGYKITDPAMARCCVSGLWLLHDFLDESHTISQNIATPSGSFWHGIMHRREGDFSNAKYWFERVGDHPVFASLTMADGSAWDAYQFVDDCQRALRTRDEAQIAVLRELQHREWQTLFDHCFRKASGGRKSPAF
jgi:hypothetical protein